MKLKNGDRRIIGSIIRITTKKGMGDKQYDGKVVKDVAPCPHYGGCCGTQNINLSGTCPGYVFVDGVKRCFGYGKDYVADFCKDRSAFNEISLDRILGL